MHYNYMYVGEYSGSSAVEIKSTDVMVAILLVTALERFSDITIVRLLSWIP